MISVKSDIPGSGWSPEDLTTPHFGRRPNCGLMRRFDRVSAAPRRCPPRKFVRHERQLALHSAHSGVTCHSKPDAEGGALPALSRSAAILPAREVPRRVSPHEFAEYFFDSADCSRSRYERGRECRFAKLNQCRPREKEDLMSIRWLAYDSYFVLSRTSSHGFVVQLLSPEPLSKQLPLAF